MIKRIIIRLTIGLLFAIPFGTVAAIGPQAPPGPEQNPECRECHPDIYSEWVQSSHGQSLVDPIFKSAWLEQGQPQECLPCHTTGYNAQTQTWKYAGITCEACHAPLTENHPPDPIPVDQTAKLCANCHQQTVFEWQISQHSQSDLTCVTCHGQHATDIRAKSTQSLCASCHHDQVENYSHSAHSESGLLCGDCHLGPQKTQAGQSHSGKDHTFTVKLATCNQCHEEEMHKRVKVTQTPTGQVITTPEPDAMASVAGLDVKLKPEPVNPIYYALFSAIIGMAMGLMLSPWIERWYQHLHKIEPPEDHEE